MRHVGRGHGKSGGYRTIHYFGGDQVPLFLLAMYGKGEKSNLTQAERSQPGATVRDWEQRRRHPDKIATSLLKVIDHAPETVERAIKAG